MGMMKFNVQICKQAFTLQLGKPHVLSPCENCYQSAKARNQKTLYTVQNMQKVVTVHAVFRS